MRTPLVFVVASLATTPSWAQTASAVERARAAITALDLAACGVDGAPSTVTFQLAVVVFPDGTWASAAASSSAPAGALDALRTCVARGLAATLDVTLPRAPRAAAVVTRTWRPSTRTAALTVATTPVEPVERHDGSLRAVCSWGQRRSDASRLPRPSECRAGLTCCAAGGAGGSDSTCMRVPAGECPAYP